MKKRKGLRIFVRVLVILFCAGLLFYLGVIGMIIWREHHLPVLESYDAVIVLGAQVKPDGTPNLQLEWRLEASLDAWKAHNCWIVVCGAQGSDEPRPEGDVMYDWLIAHDVPEHWILKDSASFNTRENLQNAAELLKDKDVKRVVIVTSDYHLARAIAIAGDEGFEATGIASRTLGGFYWVKNHAREGIAWIKYWVEKLFNIQIHNSNFNISGITEYQQ